MRSLSDRSRRARQGDDGAAAVEFALISVVFFPLMFGMIQYGYYFFQSQGASSTVREASRLAAVGLDDCEDFAASVLAAAQNNGLSTGTPDAAVPDPSRITVDFYTDAGSDVPASGGRGDVAVVTLVYTPVDFGFPLPFLSGNDTKTAQTRLEVPAGVGAPGC